MQALILAAGRGSRLDPQGTPKCLLDVGGAPLIEHQLRALADGGVGRIVMVVGHDRRRVMDAVGDRATWVHNARYAETNSLFSFHLARDVIDGDVIVCNCDVLVHPAVVKLLVETRGSVVAYDSRRGDDDEAMKVEVAGDRVVHMSKQLARHAVCGENVGMIRLDRRATRTAFRAATASIAAGKEHEWLATAINVVAARHRLRALDIDPLPWTEIDFPDDLDHARDVVWPAICAHAERARHPVGPLVGAQEVAVA